jgi:DNA-binding NarL/FixJ family response regulator
MACAVLASVERRPATCARLHGGAAAHLSLQRTVPPEYQDLYRGAIDGQRDALGSAAFERHVAEGSRWSWDELAGQALQFTDALAPPTPPEPPARPRAGRPDLALTRREHQVLELIASGHTNKEVALALGVSPKTVMHHTTRIYQKLNVRGRAGAAAVLGAQRARSQR